jgi:cyclic pyranopterin phosphate synthase
MIDPFGRAITYLRLSVTDRCDLRCLYCMPERTTFLPRADLLTLEELERLALAFVARGVRRIRITGGEPLVRKDVMTLIGRLGGAIGTTGLAEITLTTNGSRLAEHARGLFDAGVRRVNVSLDTLDADRFARITRGGELARTLGGIAAAQDAGLKIKINTVALAGLNDDELPDLMRWSHGRGHDFTLIETMPMGEAAQDHAAHHLSLATVRAHLEKEFHLVPSAHRSGGPARYFDVAETGGRLGLITPLSGNFCDGCNRIRLTCSGQLYQCLGQETRADLRAVLRRGANDDELGAAIAAAIAAKPRGHDFAIGTAAVPRVMSATGG